MNFRHLAPWAAAAALLTAPMAHAELLTYDFSGLLNAGANSQKFTGEFTYDNAATGLGDAPRFAHRLHGLARVVQGLAEEGEIDFVIL